MHQRISRAKGKSDGQWVYGYPLPFSGKDWQTKERWCIMSGIVEVVEVDPETIGMLVIPKEYEHNPLQENIWEGDVLEQWGTRYVVEFGIFDDNQGFHIELDDMDMKLLGNIHDDKFLINK